MTDSSGIDLLVTHAIETGVFPGAVLLVSTLDEVLFRKAYGYASIVPFEAAMLEDTLFDLASLTKPLATTLAIMALVAGNKLDVDQKIADFLPIGSSHSKATVTLRQLLSHCSGLPAYRPYYKRLRFRPILERKRILREWILDEPLLSKPGAAVCYSDLGFILLEWVIEGVAGMPLDRFVSEYVYRPLRMFSTGFRPLVNLPGARSIAATEECSWRRKVLCGEVHDDNAYVVGGICGHAGLFGTADDLCVLLRTLLKAYLGKTEQGLFPPRIVSAFFERQGQPAGTTWALGFDTPSENGSSAGNYFSRNSIGHLGFTGVSFWVDLEREKIVILLTNRVHPDRYNDKIKIFRPSIHDAVMKEFS